MLIGGVFIVVRCEFAIFPGGLVLGAVANLLQHLHHPSHGRPVDGERAGAVEPYVQHSAYFVLET